MKIVVAMPCAHAQAKMHATQTAVDTCLALKDRGAEVRFAAAEFSEVVWARNYLSSWALDEGATHLLFLDSDMYVPPHVTVGLLDADRPLIGALYPTRQVSVDRLAATAREQPDLPGPRVLGAVLTYAFRPLPGGTFAFDEQGVGEVEGVGMGATLIRREVFEALIAKGLSRPLAPRAGMTLPVHGFFDLLEDAEGRTLSEDFSFCQRWRQAGGKVFAKDAPQAGHVGDFVYRGSVRDAAGA